MILVFHSHHNSSLMILCFQMVLEPVVTTDQDMSKEMHAVVQLHIHQKYDIIFSLEKAANFGKSFHFENLVDWVNFSKMADFEWKFFVKFFEFGK